MVPCSGLTRSSHRWALLASTALVCLKTSSLIHITECKPHRKRQVFLCDIERDTSQKSIKKSIKTPSSCTEFHHIQYVTFSIIQCLHLSYVWTYPFFSFYVQDSHMVFSVGVRRWFLLTKKKKKEKNTFSNYSDIVILCHLIFLLPKMKSYNCSMAIL